MKSKFARKVGKNFLRIAHRGACIYQPENTLEAFQLAVDLGVDMIETDVRLTADHIPILAHDSHHIKLSEVRERFPDRESYLIRDLLFSELRELEEIGIRHIQEVYHGREAQDKQAVRDCFNFITDEEFETYLGAEQRSKIENKKYQIPSLEEALDWLKNTPDVLLNLEIKTYPDSHSELTEEVLRVLKEAPQERLLISSFDHYALIETKKRFPEISTAQLHSDKVVGAAKYGSEVLNVDAIHSMAHFMEEPKTLEREITECHQYGLGLHIWTVDKPKSMKLFLERGVDGLITNFPNRLNQVLAEMGISMVSVL